MAQTPLPTSQQGSFRISASPVFTRIIEELGIVNRQFNKSRIVRDALTEKADRQLPPNWRETVGFEEGDAA